MGSSKVYPVTYNQDYYTVVSNDVLKGKQEMTLQEARIIRLLITQVVKEDKDLKTYICNINEFAKFVNIDSSNLFRDTKTFCDNLLDKKVHIGTGNPKQPWRTFQWLQLAEYDGNGNITLMLSNQIAPYVIELNSHFTQYKLVNILTMKTYNSIRLYEFLRTDYGSKKYEILFKYSIVELREYFSCEHKYKETKDFIKRIITPSVDEINAKTDLRVIPTYLKTGRATTHISFEIHYKSQKQIEGQEHFRGDEDE